MSDLVTLSGDGSHEWAVTLYRIGGVAVQGDTVFVSGVEREDPSGSALVAIDTVSGATIWRSAARQAGTGQPIVAGGLVYVTSGQDSSISVFAADGCGATVCSPVANVPTGLQGSVGAMSVSGGAVFASSSSGRPSLVALHPATEP